MNTKVTTVKEYFSALSPMQKKALKEMQSIIKKVVPNAEEVISYGMPAFVLHSNLVYYAAQSKHIGLYPHASPIVAFKEKLTAYHCSKGAIQFPYDKPLPVKLITDIVKFRVKENIEKFESKNKIKKQK